MVTSGKYVLSSGQEAFVPWAAFVPLRHLFVMPRVVKKIEILKVLLLFLESSAA